MFVEKYNYHSLGVVYYKVGYLMYVLYIPEPPIAICGSCEACDLEFHQLRSRGSGVLCYSEIKNTFGPDKVS